jgi:SHS2 domain-containing protein
MKYEILEHRADLKIRIFGKSKEEIFSNALLAMNEAMRIEIRKPEETSKRAIKIESADPQSLLVDFLNEVLYLSQVNKEVYEVIFKKLLDKEIEGELIGKKVEKFSEDIKAATYHDLEIKQEKAGNWQAVILFDI